MRRSFLIRPIPRARGLRPISEIMASLWKCDECGGPAKWTFFGDSVYYHCEQQCDAFMQVDMFDSECYIDSSLSVSAPTEDGGHLWPVAE